MKRFAAHYLFLPNVGFMKQQVVEISDEGTVRCVFSLTEEIESVEWMPGVIALLSKDEIEKIPPPVMFMENVTGGSNDATRGEDLFPCLFYPFDFTSMQPVAETRHRLLR